MTVLEEKVTNIRVHNLNFDRPSRAGPGCLSIERSSAPNIEALEKNSVYRHPQRRCVFIRVHIAAHQDMQLSEIGLDFQNKLNP